MCNHRYKEKEEILLISDSKDTKFIISNKLKSFFLIDTDETNILKQNANYSCIIVTHFNPLTSIETIKKFKSNSLTLHLPIIVLTEPKHIEELINSEADECLSISTPAKELIAKIKRTIAKTCWHQNLNPLTKLPGNILIIEKIRKNIKNNSGLLFVDIKNFKSYNDKYGFEKGDIVILETAHLLKRIIIQSNISSNFLGHIGGDDFIIVTTLEQANKLKTVIDEQFRKTLGKKYKLLISTTVVSNETQHKNLKQFAKQKNISRSP